MKRPILFTVTGYHIIKISHRELFCLHYRFRITASSTHKAIPDTCTASADLYAKIKER